MKTGQKKVKLLYRGVFNLGREIIIRRTQAYSEAQAKAFFLTAIAKEKGLTQGSWIWKLFDGTKDNYRIEREPREG